MKLNFPTFQVMKGKEVPVYNWKAEDGCDEYSDCFKLLLLLTGSNNFWCSKTRPGLIVFFLKQLNFTHSISQNERKGYTLTQKSKRFHMQDNAQCLAVNQRLCVFQAESVLYCSNTRLTIRTAFGQSSEP